jgi:methylated-DNA-[protein]-cysteine S-methyltransferase
MSETTYLSPIGAIEMHAEDGALVALTFTGDDRAATAADDPVLAAARAQLDEYFAGERLDFNVKLDLRGSDFQRKVWDALLTIPYGETRSYGEIAKQIGRPDRARAVGAANGQNPLSIIVPCHRVIGADGSLTGYGGGLHRKRLLLDLEAGVQSLTA